MQPVDGQCGRNSGSVEVEIHGLNVSWKVSLFWWKILKNKYFFLTGRCRRATGGRLKMQLERRKLQWVN